MQSSPRPPSRYTQEPEALSPLIADTGGLSHYARLVFQGADLSSLWSDLATRATAEPSDLGALFDMSMLLQLTGQVDQGLDIQSQALGQCRLYRRAFGDGSGLRVLVIMAAGGFMANTPLDFLLQGSDAVATYLFITTGMGLSVDIPPHDVAVFAVGESDAHGSILQGFTPLAAAWPKPMINGRPDRIALLTRDGVSTACAAIPQINAPATVRLSRAALTALAEGGSDLQALLPGSTFPLIIRPVESHAGQSLSKINTPKELADYLDALPNLPQAYLTQFVDYSGGDNLFRKLRIAFIDGRPYIGHMAVSDHWMVHYLNADMDHRPERRAEEAAMMASFNQGFAQRHAEAFRALHAAIGLDYFAIDCAETSDGRLLLFEADVAMILHDMDSEDLYPYKRAPMRRLFAGFQTYLSQLAQP